MGKKAKCWKNIVSRSRHNGFRWLKNHYRLCFFVKSNVTNLDRVCESSDMLVPPLLDSVTEESDAVSSLLLSLSSELSSLEESLLESFVTLSSESSSAVEDSSSVVVVVVFLRITFCFFCCCLLSWLFFCNFLKKQEIYVLLTFFFFFIKKCPFVSSNILFYLVNYINNGVPIEFFLLPNVKDK